VAILGRMLGPEQLADVEGDVSLLCQGAGVDVDQPLSMSALCEALTGAPPLLDRNLGSARGMLRRGRVLIAPGLTVEQERHTIAHELGEWFYDRRGYDEPDREARCDAVGAALCAPRSAFKRAMRTVGHRVSVLARAFVVEQSLALLRVGEVSGRPVMLLHPAGPIVRGDPFAWPSTSALRRALEEGRETVHPIRITDAASRWGLMARR